MTSKALKASTSFFWQDICTDNPGLQKIIFMKKIFILLFIAILGIQQIDAQFLKNAKKFINSNNKGLTEKDAADGIKEALINGTGESVKRFLFLTDTGAILKLKFPSLLKQRRWNQNLGQWEWVKKWMNLMNP